jgi:hypothetical protein
VGLGGGVHIEFFGSGKRKKKKSNPRERASRTLRERQMDPLKQVFNKD